MPSFFMLILTDGWLQEENLEPSMFFLQLPPTVPMMKQTGSTAGHEVGSSSRPSGSIGSVKKTCGLEELPAGLMGKMLVYKSGAVKLKLGDTLYDVSNLTLRKPCHVKKYLIIPDLLVSLKTKGL